MQRLSFDHDHLTFSYLDAGGNGRPLLALHAHWMEARTFASLAQALAPAWRVIALDQRGHGYSSHAAHYERADYLADVDAWIAHLALPDPVVVLGNSLGGVNAYHYAATRPGRVRAMIVEDIGVVIADDGTMARGWAGTFPTREALADQLGPRMAPALSDSIRETARGWRMAFDPADMETSQRAAAGDHWQTWLASSCPALVVRGSESRVTDGDHLAEMAARRPHTELVELPGGHVVHADCRAAYAQVVGEFLRDL
jgi:pimeloyl-ACP methyl ester carboxylesterase